MLVKVLSGRTQGKAPLLHCKNMLQSCARMAVAVLGSVSLKNSAIKEKVEEKGLERSEGERR